MMCLIIVGIISVAIGLSISAFHGGFHFGSYKLLCKARALDTFIESRNDIGLTSQWKEYLNAVSVKNNKPSYLEWLKWGFSRESREA